jgi:hypothetical protein
MTLKSRLYFILSEKWKVLKEQVVFYFFKKMESLVIVNG